MLGGHAVAQCLYNEGVKHLFSVPGESYIAVVDGLVNHPEIHAKQKAYATPKECLTKRVSMERVMQDLKSASPADAITTTDAGSFGQWHQRYLEFDHANSYISPTLGCMGPGIPSGVVAKLTYPNRTVIAHAGDGGFLMTGQEMATAKQYGAPIVAIV
ncbi:MAG: hypothetical protein EXR70_18220 [Deltaproteobacteria bacterium]|nr:hypothetical protein [Deltaproteobacteria bacterium]